MKIFKIVDNISDLLMKIFRWFGVGLTLVVLFDVFMRYAMNRPTIWGFDVTLMLNTVFFLMGGAWVTKNKAHIQVDVIYDYFPEKIKKFIDTLYYLVFLIPISGVIFWFGSNEAYKSFLRNEVSNTSQWGEKIWYWKAIIPLGFFFILLQGLVELARLYIRGNSDSLEEEEV